MSIELITKVQAAVDEIFAAESKKELLTNQDYSWDGAHAIKVYKITTASMNDYGRTGAASGNWSRYGAVASLDATTETLTLAKDRSFTFAIDALDTDETALQLEAAKALARQQRVVIVPELDKYVIGKMATGAGTKPTAATLTASNIYGAILDASETLDDNEVPETNRRLIVSPAVYELMKQSGDIVLNTDIGQDLRLKGVIGNLDGMTVIKVPSVRLPANFGFMVCHPVATVAPVKLESYKIHKDPPGISGALVEGRIVYDAFVLDNKAKAIYYQAQPAGN